MDLSKQDLIGECFTDVPKLLHSNSVNSFPITLDNKNRGSLIVKCEELQRSSGDLQIIFEGRNLPSNCFLRILYILHPLRRWLNPTR